MYTEAPVDQKQKWLALALGAAAVLLVAFVLPACPPWAQIAGLILLIAALYFVLRFALRQYTYGLDDTHLCVVMQLGSRPPLAEEIPLAEVRSFAPAKDAPPKGEKVLDFRYTLLKGHAAYALRYRDEHGHAACLLFQPSPLLVAKISDGIKGE